MRSALLGLVALVALATCASAAVVTVMPDPQPTDTPVGRLQVGETTLTHGWSIVTNARGWAALSTFGPALYFSRNQRGTTPIVAGSPEVSPEKNLGRGTFYATCDMWVGNGIEPPLDDPAHDWYKTPSTCWLGTNTWNGTDISGRTLGSITKMEYYSFVDKCPQRWGGGVGSELQWWAKPGWWNGPQQPIQLQFVFVNPSGTEIRNVWHRPWGGNYVGDDGLTEPGSKKGRWQKINCMTQGKWYIPYSGSSPNTAEMGWTSWADFMAASMPEGDDGPFSGWKFAPPYTSTEDYRTGKNPGWNGKTMPKYGGPGATGTGYPLNFFVGARINQVNNPFLFQGSGISWYNHMYGERAQIDYFTLGFNGVEETYDFEPPVDEPAVQTVALNNKALDGYIWNRATFGDQSFLYSNPPAKLKFLVRVTGKVGDPLMNYNQGFTIEDGSMLTYTDPGWSPGWIESTQPNPIRVFLADDDFRGAPLWLSAGDMVSVDGYLEGIRFPAGHVGLLGYRVLWTNINNITKYGHFE
jgi:hypothetical protein